MSGSNNLSTDCIPCQLPTLCHFEIHTLCSRKADQSQQNVKVTRALFNLLGIVVLRPPGQSVVRKAGQMRMCVLGRVRGYTHIRG